MITESFTDTQSTARDVIANRRLASDLAEDPADLLDLAAALGTEFRHVVDALLRAPGRHAGDVVRSLAPSRGPRRGSSSTAHTPFVWMTLVPPGRCAERTVRAGWLSSAAVESIAAEARAAGSGTEIRIIVPLDGGDDAAPRVHALCLGFPLDLTVTIEVQRDRAALDGRHTRGPWWRTGGGSSHEGGRQRSSVGTWVVLHPAGATS